MIDANSYIRVLTLSFAILTGVFWSYSSLANWNIITESSHGSKSFVDFDSIVLKRCGFSLQFGCRRFSELIDYDKPGFSGELSTRSLVEYDCKRKVWRLISSKSFSQNMARGQVVSNNSVKSVWKNIPMQSLESLKFSLVCNQN